MTEFKYAPMFQLGEDKTEYYHIPGSEKLVSVSDFEGHKILKVSKEALTLMSNTAFRDVSFMLRRSHNAQVAKILSDPEASDNDKYVALTFLRNAEIACKGKLPICQDTGTAIVHGEKGQQVWTGFCDEEALSLGVFKTYTEENLRYSRAILEELGVDPAQRVAIVTSDFHLCRARLMWGGDTAAVPAHLPSTLYFQCLTVNYFIREAFGLAAYFVYGG